MSGVPLSLPALQPFQPLASVSVLPLDSQNFSVMFLRAFQFFGTLAKSTEPVVNLQEKLFLFVNIDLWCSLLELSLGKRIFFLMDETLTKQREARSLNT